METMVVVASVVFLVAFALARATARHNLGVARVESIGEHVDLTPDVLKTAVIVTQVMGGEVTVVKEAAKEQKQHAGSRALNDREIRKHQERVKGLTGANQSMDRRDRHLDDLVGLMPPAPKK